MLAFQAQYQPTDRPIEDRIAISQPLTPADTRIFVGVFDALAIAKTGHGGPHTAEYLSQALLPQILESITPHTPRDVVPEELQAVFDTLDARILSNFTENFRNTLKVPIQSVRRNFITKKLCQEDIRNSVECAKSGSTALVAYVEDNALYLANTGDCRAVMGQLESDGIISANQMTEDLNTKNPLERARLTSKNEEFAIVGDRVLGQIGVTRSFGDAFYKLKNTEYTRQILSHPLMTPNRKMMNTHETHHHLYPHIITPPYLIPTPAISTHTLSDADIFVVLASDGLWDAVGVCNEWVVEVVWQGLRVGSEDVAMYLLDRVKEVGRPGDDVSIVVLVFGNSENFK